ncbi:hypothetical protein ACOAPY_10565 [Pseudomonas sp. P3C3]
MLYTLKEAIEQHQYQTDGTHKFWGYFQVIAAGSAAIAWQKEITLSQPVLIALLVAFIIFSVASNYAIFSAQRQSWELSLAIKKYCTNNPAEIPAEFIGSLKSIKSIHPKWVSVWHGLISIATATAILIRAFSCA